MRQVVIGQYPIGHEFVEIVLREGKGGEFYVTPEHGHIPRIKVGADAGRWDDTVAVLLHETLEFVLFRLKCRYDPDNDLGRSSASYLFVADHNTLTDACCRVAECLSVCLPDLSTAWKQWRKKTKP
jgi:hypothetical protein